MIGTLGWLVIIAVALFWEIFAIYKGDTEQWPTLTRLILTHVPLWVVAMALGWLVYHFMLQIKYAAQKRNQGGQ